MSASSLFCLNTVCGMACEGDSSGSGSWRVWVLSCAQFKFLHYQRICFLSVAVKPWAMTVSFALWCKFSDTPSAACGPDLMFSWWRACAGLDNPDCPRSLLDLPGPVSCILPDALGTGWVYFMRSESSYSEPGKQMKLPVL